MPRALRSALSIVLAVAGVTPFLPARGQPAAPGAAASPSASTSESTSASTSASASDVEARKESAKNHFLAGIQRMNDSAWDAALAEFMAALASYPTSNTRKNAAICLTKLHRYDEALEMWQARLRDFGNGMPAAEFDQTTKAILDLKSLTGTLRVTANVDGATVVVDGRERGHTPLAEPIIVSSGTRYVRVVKEGYAPFEAKPSVAGKQTVDVDAKLEQLVRAGRLRVIEESGANAEVIVDGVAVGNTPNETVVSPGVHSVHLRGEALLGTQPVTTKVDVDQLAVLRLKLVELPSDLRIEPTPANASIVLDGVPLGQGAWSGRVTAGAHRLEASAEGYSGAVRSITVAAGEHAQSKLVLERDESSPLWAQTIRYRVSVSVYVGGAFGASLGGEYETSCGGTADCTSRTRPWGFFGLLRGGYEISPRATLEATLGYLRMATRVTRRLDLPGEGGPVPAEITDGAAFGGPFLAVGAAYALVREPLRLSVALSVGAQVARSQDDRDGSVSTDAQPSPRPLFSASSDPAFGVIPLVLPELRLSYPLSDRISIGGSLFAIVGFADLRPRIAQTAQGSPNDTAGGAPTNPQWQGKYIGFVPQQGSRPESSVGTFVLGGLAFFARAAF